MIEIISIIEITVMLLVSVMYITLLERKLMGKIQSRVGPNEVGKWGISQPILDGLKLYIKEIIVPIQVRKEIYKSTSKVYIFISILITIFIPIISGNLETTLKTKDWVIIIIIITTLSAYSILYSGESSKNSYSKLGSIRCISQLISNEVYITVIWIIIMYMNNSISMSDIYRNQVEVYIYNVIYDIIIIYIIWLISETNRAPFDISEGESELVSGWNVEYSSIYFASFMIGEYGIIIILSYLSSVLLSPNLLPWSFVLLIGLFILVRSTYCRLRQDSILLLSWKYILPICILLLIIVIIL